MMNGPQGADCLGLDLAANGGEGLTVLPLDRLGWRRFLPETESGWRCLFHRLTEAFLLLAALC